MPQRELTVAEIARLAGARIRGAETVIVRGVAPIEIAGPDDLSFVANARYLSYLQGARAGAVLVAAAIANDAPEGGPPLLVVDDPHIALLRVLPVLYPRPVHLPGIHPTAVVAPDAVIGEAVRVGPFAVIGARARIGDRCDVGAHAVVGDDCAVGPDTVLHPHVTLYPEVTVGARCVIHSGARVGREGFGFVWVDGGHRHIPQVGGCLVEDDVEIGTNCNIDRGSVRETRIGAGTKMDALAHVGHNIRVGRHALLLAQVGIAGSTTVGDGVVLAGQVGVSGHLNIGAGARVAGQGGVIGDVAPGETVSGWPARPHREQLRAQAALHKLPELTRRVRELERVVAELRGGASPHTKSLESSGTE